MNQKREKRSFCNRSFAGLLTMTVAVLMTASMLCAGCAWKIVRVKHPLIEDMRETLDGDKLVKKDGSSALLTRGYCVTDQWLTDTAGIEVE